MHSIINIDNILHYNYLMINIVTMAIILHYVNVSKLHIVSFKFTKYYISIFFVKKYSVLADFSLLGW